MMTLRFFVESQLVESQLVERTFVETSKPDNWWKEKSIRFSGTDLLDFAFSGTKLFKIKTLHQYIKAIEKYKKEGNYQIKNHNKVFKKRK